MRVESEGEALRLRWGAPTRAALRVNGRVPNGERSEDCGRWQAEVRSGERKERWLASPGLGPRPAAQEQ